MKKVMFMVVIMVMMTMATMATYAKTTDESKPELKTGFFTSIGMKADAAVGIVNKTVVKPAPGVVKGAGRGIGKGASVVGGVVKSGASKACMTVGKTLYKFGYDMKK